MSEDDLPPTREEMAAAEREAPRRRRRLWPWIALLSIVLVPALLFTLWAAIALNWSYSEGTRAGQVLKISKKGWLCKTWEGELSMTTAGSMMPEKWEFTVRNDSLARHIQQLQGQQVQLTYEERKGVPTSCFGDTKYFVEDVRSLSNVVPTPATGPMPAPVPAPPPAPAPR
jgi:hypothetical protein